MKLSITVLNLKKNKINKNNNKLLVEESTSILKFLYL